MRTAANERKRFLSVHEAARVLGVTAPTVYAWIRRRVFTAYNDQVTGQLLLDSDEVTALAPEERIRPQVLRGDPGR